MQMPALYHLSLIHISMCIRDRPNGILIEKTAVPMGVIAII